MKICSKCNLEQDESCFYKNAKKPDGLMNQCVACCKRHHQKKYGENREDYLRKGKQRRDAAVELMRFVKEESGCIRCGETKWWRLAFHHVDPSEKDFELAAIKTVNRAVQEMKKCIVVCHNCHADIHYEERSSESVG